METTTHGSHSNNCGTSNHNEAGTSGHPNVGGVMGGQGGGASHGGGSQGGSGRPTSIYGGSHAPSRTFRGAGAPMDIDQTQGGSTRKFLIIWIMKKGLYCIIDNRFLASMEPPNVPRQFQRVQESVTSKEQGVLHNL